MKDNLIETSKKDLDLLLEPLNLPKSYLAIFFSRKSENTPLNVFFILSYPDLDDLVKSEAFFKADFEIGYGGWHDYYLLVKSGSEWISDDVLDAIYEKNYAIDEDLNIKPKFKSDFEKLKEEWRKAKKEREE